jgi:hypothetical protein
MPNQLPVTIDFGTLPANGQGYTPQEFANRLGVNGRIFTEQQFALFTTGVTAPTSDTGPWAANGNSWYYWDNDTGSYVPFIIPQESLRYFVGNTEPDPDIYEFWIQLDGSGSPLALKTYFSGAWVDVYSSAGYMTVAAFNAAIAAYSTTAQMNTAISSALAPYATTAAMNAAIAASAASTLASANGYTNSQIAALTTYPAQGVSVGTQTVAIDGVAHKVNLGSAPINPAPAPFDTGNSRYVAPATGIYQVSASTQFDNDTGNAALMEVILGLFKNGVFVGDALGDQDSTPSPNGSRWSPSFSGLVALTAGDYLELFTTVNDGGSGGNITVTVAQLSVNRASA